MAWLIRMTTVEEARAKSSTTMTALSIQSIIFYKLISSIITACPARGLSSCLCWISNNLPPHPSSRNLRRSFYAAFGSDGSLSSSATAISLKAGDATASSWRTGWPWELLKKTGMSSTFLRSKYLPHFHLSTPFNLFLLYHPFRPSTPSGTQYFHGLYQPFCFWTDVSKSLWSAASIFWQY